MIRFGTSSCAAIGLILGLAFAPAPASAQSSIVPQAEAQDFQCLVVLQQRRAAFVANTQLSAAQKAEFINNLTIISAYYAGRISHYSVADMAASMATATAAVNAADAQQLDALANDCANRYLGVMEVLGSA